MPEFHEVFFSLEGKMQVNFGGELCKKLHRNLTTSRWTCIQEAIKRIERIQIQTILVKTSESWLRVEQGLQ